MKEPMLGTVQDEGDIPKDGGVMEAERQEDERRSPRRHADGRLDDEVFLTWRSMLPTISMIWSVAGREKRRILFSLPRPASMKIRKNQD